jgi:hypothetical protein
MITFSQLGNLGRIGNQLFQISTTIAAALNNDTNYIFPNWIYEKDFNIHNCFSNNLKTIKTYQEPYFHYAKIPPDKDMNLSGYFQSYKYFEDYKDKLTELLTPIYNFDREPGLCSIHVRRGDYVHQPQNHPTQNMQYYETAMKLSECSKFLIFSDDINWCKKNFIGNQFDFADGNIGPVDMAMMAKKCESNIICNSSFSWWGAFLNQNLSKKIMYPSNWFGIELKNNDTKDLCPPSWIKI